MNDYLKVLLVINAKDVGYPSHSYFYLHRALIECNIPVYRELYEHNSIYETWLSVYNIRGSLVGCFSYTRMDNKEPFATHITEDDFFFCSVKEVRIKTYSQILKGEGYEGIR